MFSRLIRKLKTGKKLSTDLTMIVFLRSRINMILMVISMRIQLSVAISGFRTRMAGYVGLLHLETKQLDDIDDL
jgi:hypothetical protein